MSFRLIYTLGVFLLITSAFVRATTNVVQSQRSASFLAVSPANIDFDSQAVGVRSQPKSATLTNVSPEDVTISDISASGIDFTQTNDCPRNLAPGANCQIEVTFTPAVTGPRMGTIIISGSDPASPRFLVLSGTGE